MESFEKTKKIKKLKKIFIFLLVSSVAVTLPYIPTAIYLLTHTEPNLSVLLAKIGIIGVIAYPGSAFCTVKMLLTVLFAGVLQGFGAMLPHNAVFLPFDLAVFMLFLICCQKIWPQMQRREKILASVCFVLYPFAQFAMNYVYLETFALI